MTPLQIPRAHERALVRLADAALLPLRARRPPSRPGPVRRVLLMRLERIGDLLMVLDAIRDARDVWPDAEIDLAVGAWNTELAMLIPDMTAVHTVSVPWLARGGAAESWSSLIRQGRVWRGRRYDVVVNFEPDIRSNFLAWLTGAPVRVGYSSGGGGSFLTDATTYVPSSHVSTNARQLVARAARLRPTSALRTQDPGPATQHPGPALRLPQSSRERARELLATGRRPFIGVHASGGRESKQWHLERFASVARALSGETGATIVLTGSKSDLEMVSRVEKQLDGIPVMNVAGTLSLTDLAALVEQLDVLVTGDTGPMHLAGAVGTPVVALFGPSDPARYGPIGSASRVLRVSLPCSPCGMVRLPPVRCRGHVPDCMDGIGVATVVEAALELMRNTAARGRPVTGA
jgi:lipopolysaccharide heptosyltransferase II